MVCRQLGFLRAVQITAKSKFGEVSETFSFDDLGCSGNERTIQDCAHVTTDDCNGSEGAGVVCE